MAPTPALRVHEASRVLGLHEDAGGLPEAGLDAHGQKVKMANLLQLINQQLLHYQMVH